MIFSAGAFLFNLLCGLVPCTPRYKDPEILPEPRSNLEYVRNLDKVKIDPIVQIKEGTIEGHQLKSTNGRVIFAFEGIPYAETTGGKNRWKPPIPKRPWKGVREAKKPGIECLQISLPRMLRVHGSESCLFINLYVPNLPVSSTFNGPYPVVVFIHGGSFIFGSGDEYRPQYLLNEDVILVTFNYRVGVLGFLSTGDEHLPGNYGMKDQALALKWIYENVESFGGNRQNITLMGNSAGGVSVHLHMISNRTRQYFTNAFSSSGTAFHHWSIQSKERMLYLANRLAARFGCQSEDSEKLERCLRNLDPNFLVSAQTTLFDWFPFPPVWFTPVVEPDGPEAFLTVLPEDAYAKGMVSNKPFIFGMTKDEGNLAMMSELIAPTFLQYKDIVDKPEQITKKVENFYFKGKSSIEASHDMFVKMFTDRFIAFGAVKGVQEHVSSGAPTYMYYFSFSEGNHNMGNTIGYRSQEWGAGHSEDIMYFFNSPTLEDGQNKGDPDTELSEIMIKILVNYAKTGVPSYTSSSGRSYEIWETVKNIRELRALKFDKNVEMISFPWEEVSRLNFWNNLNLSDTSLISPLHFSGKKNVIDFHIYTPSRSRI